MSANGDDGGQVPPVQVQPSPQPLQWILATATGRSGEKMVVLQLLTPQGSSVFFLPPDAALAMGTQMADEGQKATSGLVVPDFEPPPDIFRGKGPPQ